MAEKKINTRIQQKRETAADWQRATGFKPLDGELIVYSADTTQGPRMKVGDGTTPVPSLPFAEAIPMGIFGTCSTAAGTAAKTTTIEGFSKLKTGALVLVKFTNANTAENPTLNVNSTGAKAIYYRGAAILPNYINSYKTYVFVYNGAQWDLAGDLVIDSISGTTGRHSKFTATNKLGDSLISDDGNKTTIHSRLVVEGNGSSYDEGIRVLPASNKWSNIYFSGNSNISGNTDGGWLVGRRGASGAQRGTEGEFTIEYNNSDGRGLTLHQNGNATIYGSTFNMANQKASIQYDSTNRCLHFVFN